jgi:hypothetical protein
MAPICVRIIEVPSPSMNWVAAKVSSLKRSDSEFLPFIQRWPQGVGQLAPPPSPSQSAWPPDGASRMD